MIYFPLNIPIFIIPHSHLISPLFYYPYLQVIASKQRPRKMSMTGSDGITYQFLLKGHEDLRQDERVMQLFGLINVCFDNARSTNNRGYNIVRYSVLPLSNNSGVSSRAYMYALCVYLLSLYSYTPLLHIHILYLLLYSYMLHVPSIYSILLPPPLTPYPLTPIYR